MKESSGHFHSRRELFASVCRYAALGLLTAGAAGVFAKRRRLIRQGKCIAGGACSGCEVLARCELPAALSARETTNGGDNGGQ
ncbi:MAG: hypothetical protein ACYSWO_20940 [Planctomycetota bacterium]